MIVYCEYQDTDNSCSDPDCCSGPFSSPHVRIFSSVDKAVEAGATKEDLIAIEIDNKELVSLEYGNIEVQK